jgi:hypothetical protein
LFVLPATEKAVSRILLKHPWLPYEYAKRMAQDLKQKSWCTPDGRRIYNREYQRLRRAEAKGEVSDVAGVISGKYLRKNKQNFANVSKS